jgi:hypothetical protein
MKKLITYATPKKIQAEQKRQLHSIPSPKKRGVCAKSKGEHSFDLRDTKIYKWFPRAQGMQTRCNEYRCAYCNKKRVEFIEEPLT